MPAVFVNGDFTRHLAAFIEEHPDLDLGIACDDSRHDIIGDGIDIAFRIGDLPDSSLKARHLFLLPRVVAAPAFLARHAPLEHPRDLQRLEWIGLGMRPDSRLFRHARDDEEVRVDYTRGCASTASKPPAAWPASASAWPPPTYLSDEPIRRGELRAVLPEWRLEPLKVYAVWPPNVPASSIAYTSSIASTRPSIQASGELQVEHVAGGQHQGAAHRPIEQAHPPGLSSSSATRSPSSAQAASER